MMLSWSTKLLINEDRVTALPGQLKFSYHRLGSISITLSGPLPEGRSQEERVPSGEERGLLSRTAGGNGAYIKQKFENVFWERRTTRKKTPWLSKISTDNKRNLISVFREANVRQWHVQEGSILAWSRTLNCYIRVSMSQNLRWGIIKVLRIVLTLNDVKVLLEIWRGFVLLT